MRRNAEELPALEEDCRAGVEEPQAHPVAEARRAAAHPVGVAEVAGEVAGAPGAAGHTPRRDMGLDPDPQRSRIRTAGQAR